MYTKPYADNLRAHHTQAGLRQIDVARLLQLDCSDRLSRWENGLAMPNLVNLFKLAVLYNVKPQELYQELYRVSGDQLSLVGRKGLDTEDDKGTAVSVKE